MLCRPASSSFFPVPRAVDPHRLLPSARALLELAALNRRLAIVLVAAEFCRSMMSALRASRPVQKQTGNMLGLDAGLSLESIEWINTISPVCLRTK